MSYLALREEQQMDLAEFERSAPVLTEDEARRRALTAIMESLGKPDRESAREEFRRNGLWVKDKNDLMYRAREREGELTVLRMRVRV